MTVVTTFKKGSDVRAVCTCDCGKSFETSLYSIRRGDTKSCGCYRRKVSAKTGKANLKHGHWVGDKESPTYISWRRMKARCYDKNHDHFDSYGGRGIKVCASWLISFENFLADMGKRPTGKTLDRINPDDDYSLENCRWATAKQQAQNKRSNHVTSV